MKIIKNPAFMFILGVVTCTITTVLASSLIASNISYTPQDKTWGVDNVGAAIDSLKISKTSDNYSTDEKVVGTWIDGKPLYQKVIVTDATFFQATKINHNISNLGDVVSLSVIWHDTSDNAWCDRFRYYESNSLKYNMFSEALKANASSIIASASADNSINWSQRIDKIIFTIKYTKTTD